MSRDVRYFPVNGEWRAKGRGALLPPVVVPVDPGGDRTLPDLPTVNYTSLYTTGSTLRQTLAKVPQVSINGVMRNQLVKMPSGEFDFSDFAMGNANIGLYYPNVCGYVGEGRGQTRIGIIKNSSTATNKIPFQSGNRPGFPTTNELSLMRVGKFQGSGIERQTVLADFELYGTDQPISPANPNLPHMYNGLMNYGGLDSFLQSLRISGVPGDWNAPPGETFQLNNYKDVRTTIRDVEVDGYNREGSRVGGSPSGGNNSVGQLIEDCNFHDARVSGLTWSFSGSHTNLAAISKDVTTRRVRVVRNSNHQLAAGQRFTGFNHENVGGVVRHYSPYIELTTLAGTEWNASHMAFNCYLFDNKDIEIHDPVTLGGPPRNNGCFTVSMNKSYAGAPNAQVTPPKVFKGGVQLTPYFISGNPSATIPVSPNTHFVVTYT